MSKVVELDPFAEHDRKVIKKQVDEEENKEVYLFERDNTMNMSEEDFYRLVQERYNRIDMEKKEKQHEERM